MTKIALVVRIRDALGNLRIKIKTWDQTITFAALSWKLRRNETGSEAASPMTKSFWEHVRAGPVETSHHGTGTI